MSYAARPLLVLGGLFLTHACYSAHEHTHLLSLHPTTPAPVTSTGSTTSQLSAYLPALAAPTASLSLSTLPIDITLEVLLSLLLLTLGIVFSSEPLKPIRWAEWAASVEHGTHGPSSNYLKNGADDDPSMTAQELGQKLYGGPSMEGFGYLEDGRRVGFLDVRRRRRDFADWVKRGGAQDERKQK